MHLTCKKTVRIDYLVLGKFYIWWPLKSYSQTLSAGGGSIHVIHDKFLTLTSWSDVFLKDMMNFYQNKMALKKQSIAIEI